ncbi:hypothetical protein [Nodularia spumigena]|nr:hypothetical protein [Nodularia spumigena]MEA5615132.1 hypothetical protein [Nodularia spumigena UHCC 0040]
MGPWPLHATAPTAHGRHPDRRQDAWRRANQTPRVGYGWGREERED